MSLPTPSNNKQRLVVVGAGMAAFAFLRRLATTGGLAHYAVTLIGDEPRPCYDRVNLTDCFTDKTPDDLLLAPRDWYDAQGIELLIGTHVTAIDRASRRLKTDGRGAIPYHHLVLATGSHPFVPPIVGTDLPGVFVYRTIEDIDRIKGYADGWCRAAVLGGGLLGLEAAKALHDLGRETHVLEVAPGLMPRQLNVEASDLLQQEIEELGVAVHVQRRAEKIEAIGDRRVVHCTGHAPLEVDMVVVSAGIRPNDGLAREAGIECGPRGGIAIDKDLGTADPRIHAIGECVSLDGMLFGLVGPCFEMAEVLADNLAAQASGKATEATFTAASRASRLKLMGVDVSTLGTPIGEAAAGSLLTSNGAGFSRSLIVDKRRVVGALAVGAWPERERLSGVISEGKRLSHRQFRRFKETGSVWAESEGDSVLDWPASATVCSCLNVSRGELTDALLAGAADADGLAEATGASTVCGSCRNLLCELVGDRGTAVGPKGRVGLLVTSCVAAVAVPLLLAAGPPPTVDSVRSAWREVDLFWRDEFVKQVTGYTLLAVSLLATTLSLRKRVSWVRFGDFGTWRGLHGIVGTATLVGFLAHTSTRMGHNLTLALAITFLLLNLLGAFTGITAALESRFTGSLGRQLRAWRPKLTQAHVWLLWPLPALVAFHIISVYYY